MATPPATMGSHISPELHQFFTRVASGMLPLLPAHLKAMWDHDAILVQLIKMHEHNIIVPCWKPKDTKMRKVRRSGPIAPTRIAPRDAKRFIYSERTRYLQELHVDRVACDFASANLSKLYDEDFLQLAKEKPLPEPTRDEDSSDESDSSLPRSTPTQNAAIPPLTEMSPAPSPSTHTPLQSLPVTAPSKAQSVPQTSDDSGTTTSTATEEDEKDKDKDINDASVTESNPLIVKAPESQAQQHTQVTAPQSASTVNAITLSEEARLPHDQVAHHIQVAAPQPSLPDNTATISAADNASHSQAEQHPVGAALEASSFVNTSTTSGEDEGSIVAINSGTQSNDEQMESTPMDDVQSTNASDTPVPVLSVENAIVPSPMDDVQSTNASVTSVPVLSVENTIVSSPMDDIQSTNTAAQISTATATSTPPPHQYNNEDMTDATEQDPAAVRPATASQPFGAPSQPLAFGYQGNSGAAHQAQTSMSSSGPALPPPISSSALALPNTIAPAISPSSDTPDATPASEDPLAPQKRELLELLAKGRQNFMNENDFAPFMDMMKLRWDDAKVQETITDFLINKKVGEGSAEQAISFVKKAVEEDGLSSKVISSLELVWRMVSLVHTTELNVEYLDDWDYAVKAKRRKFEVRRLFNTLAGANFKLLTAKNETGCMTWAEMADFAERKDQEFFNRSEVGISATWYTDYMKKMREWVISRENILQLIANRKGAQQAAPTQQANSASNARKRDSKEAENEDDASTTQNAKRVRELDGPK